MAATVFDHIPRTAQGHFLLHFYAAVFRLLRYLRRLEDAAAPPATIDRSRFPFLRGYEAELQGIGLTIDQTGDLWAWWEEQLTAWEDGAEEHLPLRVVGEVAGLDARGRVALLLISLVEVDSRFGTLFAELQAPLPYRRPSLETVGHMLADNGWVDGLNAWRVCQTLLKAGLGRSCQSRRASFGVAPARAGRAVGSHRRPARHSLRILVHGPPAGGLPDHRHADLY